MIKNNGAMTFRNQSIIDYSIILELDSLFSDGHALISINLSFENDFKVKN